MHHPPSMQQQSSIDDSNFQNQINHEFSRAKESGPTWSVTSCLRRDLLKDVTSTHIALGQAITYSIAMLVSHGVRPVANTARGTSCSLYEDDCLSNKYFLMITIPENASCISMWTLVTIKSSTRQHC